jgi:hypothetical protein
VSTRCWPRSALPAVGRLLDLMARVRVAELTTPEVQGLVAVFEAADQRENAGTAPVLALIAGDSEVGQP